jgi:hypothetical protein
MFVKNALLLTAFCTSICANMSAQNISRWEKWFGDTTRYESAHSLKQFPDGSIYVLGHAADSANNPLVSLSKLDSTGTLLWVKKFGNSTGNPIGGEHLIITKDNKLVTIGALYQGNDIDELLTKLDTSGNILWQNLHGDVHKIEYPTYVEQTTDFGYIACGYTSQANLAGNDILVLKYAANGDLEWWKEFGGNSNDVGNMIHQTADGGYVLSGDTQQATLDNYVLKLDASGTKSWDLVVGDGNANGNLGLLVNTEGNYILVGESTTVADPDFDIYMVKVSATGNLLWAKYIGDSGADAGFSVVENASKEYIITGYSNSYDSSKPIRILVCKTDSLGNARSMNYLGSAEVNIGYEIIPSVTGGCLIAGFSLVNGNDQGYVANINEAAITSIPKGSKTNASFDVFPNPVTDNLQITGSPINTYSIFDASGNVVMENKKNKAVTEINISGLPDGVYLIRVDAAEKTCTRKFIKTSL